MPLYEFRCDACGVFEDWRILSESSVPAPCPSCGTSARRIFSAPRLQLSGTLRFKTKNPEPQLVKREIGPPDRPQARSHQGGRPWMIGH